MYDPSVRTDRLASLIGCDARRLSADSLNALAGPPESDVLDFKRLTRENTQNERITAA